MTTKELSSIKTETLDTKNVDVLYGKVTAHIDQARATVHKTVSVEMVKAYWLIGKEIVEEEQQGKSRADYGSYLLQALSDRLTQQYKKGFSVSTLRDIRQFYLTYSDHTSIHHAVRGELKQFSPSLGWIHYRALMRISRKEARQFYEVEAIKNHWSGRELERQVGSLLFDRFAKSKDKGGYKKTDSTLTRRSVLCSHSFAQF